VRVRLIALSLLAGIVVPASSALAAPPLQPSAGSGGIGVRLLGVPADSRHDPLARSYLVDRLAPGTTIRRRIEISNSTRLSAEVAVYPAAASLRRGMFRFAPGRSRNELSSWTSLSREVLRLPPGTTAFVTVTIDVPKEASSGERYAVVWAEVSTPASTASGVRLVNRVGIRMYVSIGRGGARASDFVIGSLIAERSATGEPLVVARIHNSGRRSLDISGNLTLSSGPGGLRAGPLPVKLTRTLAPGDSETLSVRLDKQLPLGPWRAHLRLRSGLLEREAVATIRFPHSAGLPQPAARSGHPFLVVTMLLVLLGAAAAALVLYRRLTRGNSKPADLARTDGNGAPQDGSSPVYFHPVQPADRAGTRMSLGLTRACLRAGALRRP
jgi:hypothetical protein